MKKIYMIVVIIVLLSIITSCKYSGNPIPNPVATVENTSITVPVEIISYYWGSKTEYGGPWEKLVDKKGVLLPKKSKIIINFDRAPKEVYQYGNWLSIDEFLPLDIETNEILVPDTEGSYIYSFSAKWPEGDVQYALKVQVE
ncbi:hypothetical protein [Paenibacillus sp. FSL H8-0332]|uniref:hypothetical protein n=1 Tax=Paenibacillus sp. FSL H8-0332 TaxID=2954742 RepID=UPI0030CDCB90